MSEVRDSEQAIPVGFIFCKEALEPRVMMHTPSDGDSKRWRVKVQR